MSESIDILIAADDKASAKLLQVGNNAELLGKRVKETGRTVKASTELVGSFSNVLGNTQFGGAAGQLAQLTERVSAFSEVAKMGGTAALFLKAGIVAAVGVAAFKIGEAIGNWAFETERWKKELQEAAKAAEKLQGIVEKNRSKRFAEAREDISLEINPADREKATQAQLDKLKRESEGIQTRLDLARKEVAERKAASKNDLLGYLMPGNAAEELKTAQSQLDALQRSKQAIDEERQALAESINERAKSIEARKADNAASLKSSAFVDSLQEEIALLKATTEEQRKLTAERNAPKQANKAEELLKERDAIREQLAEKKRIADLENRELDRLELRRIELEQGKEAAKAYALQMEGLSEEFSRSIAARESALDAMKNSKPDKQTGTAVQGRLLTQGGTTNPVVEMLKKLIVAVEKGTKDTSKALRESAKDEPFVVKTVTVP